MSNRNKSVANDDPLFESLSESLDPVALPPERSRKLWERIVGAVRMEDAGSVTVRADDHGWQPYAPGVDIKKLHEDDRSNSFLLRLAPGATLSGHDHAGEEVCVMLAGEIMIGDLALSAGDYHLAFAGTRHGAISSATGGMLFIRSAVPASRGVHV